MELDKNLEIAIEASVEAGKKIMEVYLEDTTSVNYKSDDSPLTKADLVSNDVINQYLKDTGIPIISEENKQLDYSVRKDWDTCWLVDPLDGTKEFIKRNGEFTVNIAMIQDNHPILGVIYVPVTKELYFADVKEQFSKKIVVSEDDPSSLDLSQAKNLELTNNESDTINIVGSRSHMSTETLDFIKEVEQKTGKKSNVVSKGSSLKFCVVAEGNADMYPRFAPTMEWDTGAGHAICSAIGLKITSQETNEPLMYNKENLLNPWFLVAKEN